MFSNKKAFYTFVMFIASYFTVFSSLAEGGISIQGTRIIYPLDAKQESLSIRNSSTTNSFLVQSWTENATGKKSKDFVVTPPLYLSEHGNENNLRLMLVNGGLPQDRESLYYFVAKAIPSIDDSDETPKSVLRISTATRIKLFVRPSGLSPDVEKAPDYITFHRVGNQLKIVNPTPYFITLTKVESDREKLKNIMVSPKASVFETLSINRSSTVTFHTINDYGAITKAITKKIQ